MSSFFVSYYFPYRYTSIFFGCFIHNLEYFPLTKKENMKENKSQNKNTLQY